VARQLFDKYYSKPTIVDQMKIRALIFNGLPWSGSVIDSCTAIYTQKKQITQLIYTKDIGTPFDSWFKTPDYERCFHLALTYWHTDWEPKPNNEKETNEWLHLFFDPFTNWVWAENVHGENDKKLDIWHYRLFTDTRWKPITPQGGVYSKLKTELHWLSYSDLNYEIKKRGES